MSNNTLLRPTLAAILPPLKTTIGIELEYRDNIADLQRRTQNSAETMRNTTRRFKKWMKTLSEEQDPVIRKSLMKDILELSDNEGKALGDSGTRHKRALGKGRR